MSKIIHSRDRATCEIVRSDRVRKRFRVGRRGVQTDNERIRAECFEREVTARRIFKGYRWMSPILRQGRYWFDMPHYAEEAKLKHVAQGAKESTRLKMAVQAMDMAWDIFQAGYAHCDLHAGNIFWVDGHIVVIDFETMQPYPPGKRPAFPLSYDVTGQGLSWPFRAVIRSCYTVGPDSLENTLGVSAGDAIAEIVKGFGDGLRGVSRSFRTTTNRRGRHKPKARNTYSSFSLPHTRVPLADARRDSDRRLKEFGLGDAEVGGKSVLDLGCHMGGVLFEMQKHHPARCLGIEYDNDKVNLANQVAAFNGLNNVRFMQADMDRLKLRKASGPYDIVLCLALEAHVSRPDLLYRNLGKLTAGGGLLCFEGNYTTDVKEAIASLKANGFTDVRYLGQTDDDRFDKKNQRSLITARRLDR